MSINRLSRDRLPSPYIEPSLVTSSKRHTRMQHTSIAAAVVVKISPEKCTTGQRIHHEIIRVAVNNPAPPFVF